MWRAIPARSLRPLPVPPRLPCPALESARTPEPHRNAVDDPEREHDPATTIATIQTVSLIRWPISSAGAPCGSRPWPCPENPTALFLNLPAAVIPFAAPAVDFRR